MNIDYDDGTVCIASVPTGDIFIYKGTFYMRIETFKPKGDEEGPHYRAVNIHNGRLSAMPVDLAVTHLPGARLSASNRRSRI
jgi:hypothetical protein